MSLCISWWLSLSFWSFSMKMFFPMHQWCQINFQRIFHFKICVTDHLDFLLYWPSTFRFPQKLWPIYVSWTRYPEFTSIKVQDAWSAVLSLLGTYFHWLTSLFSWICWKLWAASILNFFVVFLIYPSTTLLSDQNVSCRQPIFNSFLKNFVIFTNNIVGLTSAFFA